MTKEEVAERLSSIGLQISKLIGELFEEQIETDSREWLQFVKCESPANSELKKMPRKFYNFRELRRHTNTKLNLI